MITSAMKSPKDPILTIIETDTKKSSKFELWIPADRCAAGQEVYL